jgi:hypothetical protein
MPPAGGAAPAQPRCRARSFSAACVVSGTGVQSSPRSGPRERNPSRARICSTCDSAVRVEMHRRVAISRSVSPPATSTATCCCREVSGPPREPAWVSSASAGDTRSCAITPPREVLLVYRHPYSRGGRQRSGRAVPAGRRRWWYRFVPRVVWARLRSGRRYGCAARRVCGEWIAVFGADDRGADSGASAAARVECAVCGQPGGYLACQLEQDRAGPAGGGQPVHVGGDRRGVGVFAG